MDQIVSFIAVGAAIGVALASVLGGIIGLIVAAVRRRRQHTDLHHVQSTEMIGLMVGDISVKARITRLEEQLDDLVALAEELSDKLASLDEVVLAQTERTPAQQLTEMGRELRRYSIFADHDAQDAPYDDSGWVDIYRDDEVPF